MEQTVGYRRRGSEGTLTLVGTVDIFEAQALRAAALRALSDDKALTLRISAAQAERLDISALQLLCALRRQAELLGKPLTVSALTPAVADSCQRIGCTL